MQWNRGFYAVLLIKIEYVKKIIIANMLLIFGIIYGDFCFILFFWLKKLRLFYFFL